VIYAPQTARRNQKDIEGAYLRINLPEDKTANEVAKFAKLRVGKSSLTRICLRQTAFPIAVSSTTMIATNKLLKRTTYRLSAAKGQRAEPRRLRSRELLSWRSRC